MICALLVVEAAVGQRQRTSTCAGIKIDREHGFCALRAILAREPGQFDLAGRLQREKAPVVGMAFALVLYHEEQLAVYHRIGDESTFECKPAFPSCREALVK